MRTYSFLAGLFALALSSASIAQDYSYHAYVDTDSNPATGCDVVYPGGTVLGAERRLTAEVIGTNVTAVRVANCVDPGFGAATSVGGGYPVGLNIGISGSDVIEWSATRAELGATRSASLRLALVGESAGGASDVLLTNNGQVGGGPIVLGLPLSIPVFGGLGIALLIVALLWVGARRARRVGLAGLGALLFAGAVWAANFVSDGAIADWTGVSPRATDASGDATPPDDGADLLQFFAEFENGTIYFRADVVDVENQRPVANDQAQTYLEDAAAQTIILTGTDGDGDPLTFSIVSNPTLGTLGPITPINATSASVSYTPNLNANGADSFTFSANDGQSTSLPATVSITLTPVNDVPSFTVGPNITVLKDLGPQTINPWATALSAGPADESGQTLSFTITANDNPALFSVAPTVNAAGALSFTSAPNANGVANLSVQIQDNGGTANGGIDTSAAQNFSISLTAVNDAPSFTAGANQTVNEDAGAQNVAGWATAISAGPPDEAGQTLTFNITNNTNAALFSAGPAVSAAGDLTYTPAANANGSATITLVLMDNGGTANGGVDTSPPQSFTISVTAVNDVPSFTSGGNVTVLKDTGPQTVNPWATAISAGPPDEAGQTLSFNITGNTNAGLFSAQPAVSPTGVLTFTGAANANGTATITLNIMDNGGTANGGVDTSATQTFDITLTAVNDAPSFTAGGNQTVLEDAGAQNVAGWATAISAGPPDEAGQTLTFNITNNTNAGLFSAGPAVSPTGDLTYTPAANANGSATITLVLMDNGGTANGGVDTSPPQMFTINVTAVNDVPSFTAGPNQTINEDAGPQTVNPWATALSAGPADEASQTLSFNITNNTNAALFSAGPTVSPTGVLTYTAVANTSGSATITLNIMDNGGTANGGIDTSATQTFDITVNSVNDVPSFTVGPDQAVNEDAGPQTVNPWATGLSAGPPSESGQTLSFNITGNTNPALFSAGPAVSPTGVLTYTPAANAFGAATITLNIMDNGGTANGGIDTSATQTFVITVTAVNDVPSFTAGPNQAVAQNAGPQTVNPWATAVSAGPANESAQTLTFNITANTNPALFSAGPAVSSAGVLTYTPALNASGNATITLNIMDNGGTANGGVDTSATQSFMISVDSAPTVTATTPTNGLTVPNNQALSVTFSENITTTGAAVTLTCGGPNLITGGATGTNVGSLTPTYAGSLPSGNCVLTVVAANVTDSDLIDPPDNMAADFVVNFTVDAAPSVSTLTPANGATNQSNTVPVVVTFSEPVATTGTSFTVECPVATPIAFTASGGPTVYTLTPTTGWPGGVTCTVTVVAAQISDVDAFDPPNLMVTDFVSTFATDAAPTITGGTPLNGATNVATNTVVTYTFDENVDDLGGAITLNCAGAITGVITGTGTSTLTFTPSAALPVGTLCTATAVAANIGDTDTNDPPQNPAADVVRTFTTDAPPSVSSTVPANGAMSVAGNSTITINFSESVNFSTLANAANSSFDFECPLATPADFIVVTASPAASVVLDPLDSAVAGQTCTLFVRAAGITDADLGDPPDNMLADFSASFSFAAVANDDAYPVTNHLTLSAPAAAGTDANDILGAAVITGFGATIGTANSTAPGTRLDDGANGSLLLNANGTFTFFPPATPAGASTDFFYTVTGGDTAMITYTYQSELVWFVDNTPTAPVCTGSNVGTQACPAALTSTVTAVDTANDAIFVASGNYTGQTALEAGEFLIGDGSSSTLGAILTITPVTGSAFPAFSAAAPVLSTGGLTDCVVLGTGNTIRGVTIANCGGASGDSSDINGTGFGTLTVAETTLNGTGRALRLTTGTLTGSFLDIDVTAATGEGIRLDAVGGTWSVAGQLNFGNTGLNGIEIRNAPASANMTLTGGAVVAKTSAGSAVLLDTNNAGAMLNLGSVVLSNTNGTAFSSSASPVTITGAGSTLTATNGPALTATNTTFTGGVTFATVSSTNSATQGVNLDTITGAVIMNGGAIGTPTGIAFDLNAGSANVTYAGTITNTAAARLIEVTARTGGTTTFSGNISGTGASTGINIANNTGGTINLSGATKMLTTGANAAVTLATNTGSNINFTGGGLAINTTSGTGFNATGGATGISVQGAGNTITTTTGSALNVNATTVGAAGLTFQSINSATASANQVISLTTTGAGPVSITGTGAAGSGGTIDNKTNDAIRFSNTGGLITLDRMIIEDIGDMAGASNTISTHDAIHGENVNGGLSMTGTTIRRISDQAIHGATLAGNAATVWNGLILEGVTIEDSNRFHVANVGDANNEGTVRIIGLRGTVTVNNSTFQRGGEFFDTFVTAGTLNMTVTNSSFSNAYKEFTVGALASVGGHCIDVVVQGAGAANVTIGNRAAGPNSNIFLNCRLGSLRFVNDAAATGNSDFIVARNTFTVNDGSSGIGGDYDFPQGGILAWNLGNGPGGSVVDTIIENNTFTDVSNASGGVGQLTLIAEGGLLQALVQNNSFIRPGNAPWLVQSRNTVNSNARVQFLNNTVTGGPSLCTTDPSCGGGYTAPGLRTLFDASTGATLDATLNNNSFPSHDTTFDPGETVEFRGLAPTGGIVCADLMNNLADDGYSLEPLAGTMRTVGAGSCPVGAPSANCQTVLGNRGNRGGANNMNTNPPFVRVVNAAVTVGAAVCTIPNGGPF